MRRRIAFVLGLILAGSLAGALVWSLRSSAAPEPSRQVTFRDRDGINALSLEADVGSTRAGEFAFRAPEGTYVAVGRATIELKGGRQLKVRYDGPVDLVTPSALRRVPARLQGEFDLSQHRGEAKFWVSQDPNVAPLSVRTAEPSMAGAERVLASFERSMVASDWPALYAVFVRELSDNISLGDFATSADAQTLALGRVVEARRIARSEPTTNPAGITYITATYVIGRSRRDGTIERSTYDLYLVLDPDTWRVWFSAPR